MGTDLIFADGFVRQNDATTAQELVLAHPSEVGVPISVTIQYILLNGAMQTINLLLDAGSVKRVSAAQALAGLGTQWYSTRVITSAPVLASVRHVDMRAGGAWISGATVLRA